MALSKNLDEITVSSASQLPFVHAAINESLRLHPTRPVLSNREVNRPGVIINGYPVPLGVGSSLFRENSVLADLDTRGNSNENNVSTSQQFRGPLVYNPERWLKDADSRFDRDRKECYKPFMVGPRSCLGQA